MDDRDTHFKGWARTRWSEIREELRNFLNEEALDVVGGETESAIQTILAQAAYDLVKHAVEHLSLDAQESHAYMQELMAEIPDHRQPERGWFVWRIPSR